MVPGMGEQVPLETVNQFVKTALPRTGEPPTRQYFSRPDVVSRSYETRKMAAYAQPVEQTAEHPRVHDRFEKDCAPGGTRTRLSIMLNRS